MARITAETRPADVPVLLVYIPERAQAAMETGRYKLPPEVNPSALPNALRTMAEEHGVKFLDSTPQFAAASYRRTNVQALRMRFDSLPSR